MWSCAFPQWHVWKTLKPRVCLWPSISCGAKPWITAVLSSLWVGWTIITFELVMLVFNIILYHQCNNVSLTEWHTVVILCPPLLARSEFTPLLFFMYKYCISTFIRQSVDCKHGSRERGRTLNALWSHFTMWPTEAPLVQSFWPFFTLKLVTKYVEIENRQM